MAGRFDNSLQGKAYHFVNHSLRGNPSAYPSFLQTMAKYHKYPWEAQALLHQNAPEGTTLVASAAVWEKTFGTTVKDDATLIPLIRPKKQGGGYESYFVVDVSDTSLTKEQAQNLQWQYHEEDKAAVLEEFGADADESITDAVAEAVQSAVEHEPQEMHSAYRAAVAYIVYERLGIAHEASDPRASMPPETMRMDRFLTNVNAYARGILASVEKAVKVAQEVRKEKEDEREQSEPARDRGGLRRVRDGRVAQSDEGVSHGESFRGVQGNAARGETGELSAESREGAVGAIRQSGTSDRGEGRNSVHTQQVGVGSDLRRENTADALGRSFEHGQSTSAGDFDARILEAANGRLRVDLAFINDIASSVTSPKEKVDIYITLYDALRQSPRYSDFEKYAFMEVTRPSYEQAMDALRASFLHMDEQQEVQQEESAVSTEERAADRQEETFRESNIETQAAEPLSVDERAETAQETKQEESPVQEEERPAPVIHVTRTRLTPTRGSAGEVVWQPEVLNEREYAPNGEMIEPTAEQNEPIAEQKAAEASLEATEMEAAASFGTENPIDTEEEEQENPQGTLAFDDSEVQITEAVPEQDPFDFEDLAGDEILPEEAEALEEELASLVVDPPFMSDEIADLDFTADMSDMAGKRAVFARNLTALKIVRHLDETGHLPNEEELRVLRAYAGFGGLSEAFDEGNASWQAQNKEIKEFLTEAEYASARATTLDAFYTPSDMISAIYDGLNAAGFSGGHILDPSTGTGRFLRDMPEAMKEKSSLTGVELDTMSARVAGYVTDGANILNKGFEKTMFPDGAFDLAISNVPFGNHVISDSRYPKSYFVHDYFLTRMMDQTRAGGLVVAITSHGTMDKKDPTLREELARKAELVQAIRLPNTIFEGAGTDVVTDLLIFRKREQELAIDAPMPSWVNSVNHPYECTNTKTGKRQEVPLYYNSYFDEHQEQILGEHTFKTTAYGIDVDVETIAAKEEVLAALKERLSTLPRDLYQASLEERPVPQEAEAETNEKVYGFYKKDGKIIFINPKGESEEQKLTKAQYKKYALMIDMRDTMREMFDAELAFCSDAELAAYQTKLKQLYDSYHTAYGRIREDSLFQRAWKKDASYSLFRSLENYEEDTFKNLADLFTKRTILAYRPPVHVDTPHDAFAISLQERGKVDFPYMEKLTGDTKESLLAALEFKEIYQDLQTGRYVATEEYLSGDVRGKLEYLSRLHENTSDALRELAKNTIRPSLTVMVEKNATLFPENFNHWMALGNLSDKEKLELFEPKNRAAFYQALKCTSAICRNDYLDFLSREAPQLFEETFKYPYFYIECAANGVPLNTPLLPMAQEIKNQLTRTMGISLESLSPDSWYAAGHEREKEYIFAAFGKNKEEIPLLSKEEKEAFIATYPQRLEAAMQQEGEEFSTLREKLSRIEKNMEALEKVKPKDLFAEDITVNLGATWIPSNDIEVFAERVLGANTSRSGYVKYSEATSEWRIEDKAGLALNPSNSVALGSTYGTSYKNAIELLEAALNHRSVKIFKKEEDGTSTPLPEETMLANQKMDAIRSKFTEWIFQDEERKNRLVAYYNRHFNNLVQRSYDGSKLVFPGMSPEVELKEHQKNAVARILYGGNTLLAHAVGAGKSFEMQASLMEAKRIGLCKKALMIMPKHLTADFGAEFNRLYPNAKVLVATEKDFQGAEKRKEFFAKIISQDWDAIIASYEQFQKLPLSKERQEKFLTDEIERLHEALAEQKKDRRNGGRSFTVKQMELALKKLHTQLNQVQNSLAKNQDNEYTFEQLGVDRLYVDEAHYYKNLSFLTNIEGLNTQGNLKTMDLLAKVQYLNELTGERGVVFATGTPVSNSMAELYTMQRYLKPSRLKSQGLQHFDSWASSFGRDVTSMEIDPAGTGFCSKTRFSQFNNLPELISMFHEFADVKMAEDLNLPVPDYRVEVVKAQPSPLQLKIVDALAKRAENVRNGNPARRSPDADEKTKKGMDNILTVMRDGMNASLDPRILNPNYKDFAGSKVNLCVQNILGIYHETSEQKSTQLVFCDLSTPKGKNGGFTVYDDIREKLIKGGVSEEEIAFIHDYDKTEEKKKLFEKVRQGKVRVLLGSSDKLGVGTNVQDKLIATHDLDCPWKPSQLEQRLGRIVRRGNENKNVKIFRYVTDSTFDSYMWQTVERKARFIGQVMKSHTSVRSAEDCDEFTMTAAQIKACCTGNPLYKQQFELQNDLEKLGTLRNAYLHNQGLYRSQLAGSVQERLSVAQDTVARLETSMEQIEAGKEQKNLVFGNLSIPPENIGKALAKIAKAVSEGAYHGKKTPRGEYGGMRVSFTEEGDFASKHTVLRVSGAASVDIPIYPSTPEKNAQRLETFAELFEERLANRQDKLAAMRSEKEKKEEFINTPFPQEDEYQQKVKRLADVNKKIHAEENASDKEAELQDRLALVGVPEKYQGEDEAIKKYLSLASQEFHANGDCYRWEQDHAVAHAMADSGIAAEEIRRVLASCSPMVHDEGTLETIMSKQVQEELA